jgi:hypothetical protein
MGEEKEILLRRNVCAYLTCRLMGDPKFFAAIELNEAHEDFFSSP